MTESNFQKDKLTLGAKPFVPKGKTLEKQDSTTAKLNTNSAAYVPKGITKATPQVIPGYNPYIQPMFVNPVQQMYPNPNMRPFIPNQHPMGGYVPMYPTQVSMNHPNQPYIQSQPKFTEPNKQYTNFPAKLSEFTPSNKFPADLTKNIENKEQNKVPDKVLTKNVEAEKSVKVEVPKEEKFIKVENALEKPNIKEEAKVPEKEEKRLTKGDVADSKKKAIIIGDENTVKGSAFSVAYLLQFKNWKIAKETTLLSNELVKQIDSLKDVQKEKVHRNKPNGKNEDQGKMTRRQADQPVETSNQMNDWVRPNYKPEIEKAEKFINEYKQIIKDQGVKVEIKQSLSKLTVDNLILVHNEILTLTKDSIDAQKDFIDVVFTKATMERGYCELYSKLINKLSKSFTTEVPKESTKSLAGIIKENKEEKVINFRSLMVEKVRSTFQKSKKDILEEIHTDDAEDLENRLKQYTIGNVNFISELIQSRFLPKKIFEQCCSHMYNHINKCDDGFFEDQVNCKEFYLNVEGIVLAADKFGTFLNKVFAVTPQGKKGEDEKEQELEKHNKVIEEWISKMEELMEKHSEFIPGHVKYKVINLREKKRRGWVNSLIEDSKKVKGLKEVHEEPEKRESVAKTTEKKLNSEELEKRMKLDFKQYKEFLEKGSSASNYNWKIVTNLMEDLGHELEDLIEVFDSFIPDFVCNEKDVKPAVSYIEDIISYYEKTLSSKQTNFAKAIVTVVSSIPYNISECKHVGTLWTEVISFLVKKKLFSIEHFAFFEEPDSEDDLEIMLDILAAGFAPINYDKTLPKIKEFNFVKKYGSKLQMCWKDPEFKD